MARRDTRWLDTLFPSNAERTLPWTDQSNSITLYRPVGPAELNLIARSHYRAFPPRLPDQPIFYPVLNFAYAEEIARDWNATRDAHAGFVTRFRIDGTFVRRYPIYVVGSEHTHQELWVPAEELEHFNEHLQGRIEVVASYYGPGFEGKIDPVTNLPAELTQREDA